MHLHVIVSINFHFVFVQYYVVLVCLWSSSQRWLSLRPFPLLHQHRLWQAYLWTIISLHIYAKQILGCCVRKRSLLCIHGYHGPKYRPHLNIFWHNFCYKTNLFKPFFWVISPRAHARVCTALKKTNGSRPSKAAPKKPHTRLAVFKKWYFEASCSVKEHV